MGYICQLHQLGTLACFRKRRVQLLPFADGIEEVLEMVGIEALCWIDEVSRFKDQIAVDLLDQLVIDVVNLIFVTAAYCQAPLLP